MLDADLAKRDSLSLSKSTKWAGLQKPVRLGTLVMCPRGRRSSAAAAWGRGRRSSVLQHAILAACIPGRVGAGGRAPG